MADTKELSLESRIESVDEAAKAAAKFAKPARLGEEALFAIDLAVRESVANAVKHGNKFDEAKQVKITFSSDERGLEIVVRDFGTGFLVDDVPDPTDPDNLLKANGRGILFMNTFMDEVEWQTAPDGGLIVKMLKKR